LPLYPINNRFGKHAPQVVLEAGHCPLIDQILVGQNEQNDGAVVHFVSGEMTKGAVSLRVVRGVLQIKADPFLLFPKKTHQLFLDPLLRGLVVADKHIVVLVCVRG